MYFASEAIAARQAMSRRHLFQRMGTGVGAMALASLLHQDSPAAGISGDPLVARAPHIPARA